MKNTVFSVILLSSISFTSLSMAADLQQVIDIENKQVVDTYLKLDEVLNEEAPAVEAKEPEKPKIEFNQAKFNHFLKTTGAKIAADPVIAGSIMTQNKKHANLTQDDIDRLDKQWRSGDKALIDPSMDNVLSNRLKRYVKEYDGIFTEMFVMDNKGLNVGQSYQTSDYWQGDEAKFIEAYNHGKGALHVEDAEYDASMGIVQIMTGQPVRSYITGEVIGTISIAINPNKIR